MRPADRTPRPTHPAGPRRATRVFLRAALVVTIATLAGTVLAQLPAQLPHLPEHHLEVRLLALTNEARSDQGTAPLAHSDTLAQAARHHVEEMVRLGYFSHVSPSPGRGSPDQRVRMAGGTLVTIGENLAEVSARDLEAAGRIIGGWLASPGHRATLLNSAWTHVGFGLAEDANGRLYAAQVFAADPTPLRAVSATRSPERTLALHAKIAVSTSGVVALATSEGGMAPRQAAAGSVHTLVLEGLSADAPSHVRLGWSPGETSDDIGQLSGWFDPATGRWTEDWAAPERHVEVLRYASTEPVRSVMLHLSFAREPRDGVVLVDGAQVAATTSGATVSLRLPGRDGIREVIVGMPEPDGLVRVVHAFEVRVAGDQLDLR